MASIHHSRGRPPTLRPRQDTRPRDGEGLLQAYLRDVSLRRLLSPEEERALGLSLEAGRIASAILAAPGMPATLLVRRVASLTDDPRVTRLLRLGPKGHELRRALVLGERRGHDARQRLIECNLRLVFPIARHYMRGDIPFLDLLQEGNLGLIRAVDRWEASRGYRLSTYATWWIRQAVGQAVDREARRARHHLHPGRLPLSLDAMDAEGGEQPGAVALTSNADGPEQDCIAGLLQRDVLEALEALADIERTVVETRFGLREPWFRTRPEAVRGLGISYSTLRRIEARALKKLRHPIHARRLAGYLLD